MNSKSALLFCIASMLLLAFSFFILPGRTDLGAVCFAGYWERAIFRLYNYQQLIAGVLTLIAGGTVIAAAIIQRNAQKQQIKDQRRIARIDLANVLVAEINNLITVCDEFEVKFDSNLYAYKGKNITISVPLPHSSDIYKTGIKGHKGQK